MFDGGVLINVLGRLQVCRTRTLSIIIHHLHDILSAICSSIKVSYLLIFNWVFLFIKVKESLYLGELADKNLYIIAYYLFGRSTRIFWKCIIE